MDVWQADLLKSASSCRAPLGKSTLLLLKLRDLSTFAPTIYDFADQTVFATSFNPQDFWRTFPGKMILAMTKERIDSANVRRLFVDTHLADDTREVMEHHTAAGVKTAFLPSEEYAVILLPVLKDFYEKLRPALARAPDLPASDEFFAGDPAKLAVAVYGNEDREHFLGFDFSHNEEVVIGLLLDPPVELWHKVKSALQKAWNLADQSGKLFLDAPDKRIYLFGAHRWNRQSVIRECLAAGYRVTLCLNNVDRTSEGAVLEQIVHEVLHFNAERPPAIPKDPKRKQAWVLGLDDYVCADTATLAQSLGSPCYPILSSAIVLQKAALRSLWNEFAQRNPDKYASVQTCTLFRNDVIEEDRLPSPVEGPHSSHWIVKPNALSASLGIHFATSITEVREAVANIRQSIDSEIAPYATEHGIKVDDAIIIEAAIPRSNEFHLGAEYSTEWISVNGKHYLLGITQKWTTAHYIECCHVFPTEGLSEEIIRCVEDAVSNHLTALNVNYTLSHWEFIITPLRRIALIEGHLRPPGDHILDLIELSTGRHPVSQLLERLPLPSKEMKVPKTRRRAGICYFKPSAPIVRVKEVRRLPTEQSWHSLFIDTVKLCERTLPWAGPSSFFDRFAYAIATGPTAEEICRRCREAAKSIELEGTCPTTGTEIVTKLDLCEAQ